MLKKAIVTMASVVALAGFAQAAQWKVTVSVSPSGSATLTGGKVGFNSYSGSATKTILVTAKPAYNLKRVVVNGVATTTFTDNAFSKTFDPAVKLSNTLSATLAIKTFAITSTAPKTGEITTAAFSPVKYAGVKYDSSRVVTVIPKKGYEIQSVLDNGSAITVYRDRAATTPVTPAELAAEPSNVPVYVVLSGIQANHALTATTQVAEPVQARISPNTTQTAPWALFKFAPTKKIVFNALKSTGSAGIASYSWSLDPDSAATLVPSADNKTVAFFPKSGGDSTLTLTVTDKNGYTDTTSVQISITGDFRVTGCALCHKNRTPVVMSNFSASLHATKENPLECASCHTNHATAPSDMNAAKAACAACHTGKAAVYAKSTHATGEIAKAYYGGGVKCSDCHNPHSSVATYGAGTANGCQKCHSPGQPFSIYSSNLAAKAPHGGGTALVKAQYLSLNTTCAECHASHDNTYNIEFAESAHGNVSGEGWMHYDWRANNRAACQRCHNSDAFVAKLGNENNTTNIFLPADANLPGGVLKCSGCHADVATGELREVARPFTVNLSNSATVTYDVPGPSGLCVRCHGGRETGDSIKNDADADGVRSFINSHYLSAGGTVYNKTGYEFAGQTYDNLGYHKNVGLENAYETGTKGSCVACHMGKGKGHTWEIGSKDEAGKITSVDNPVCGKCHGGLTGAAMEASKESYHVALTSLKAALEAKGIYFFNAHPYFYNGAGGTGGAFTNWASVYGLDKWKDVMGAAFNFNMLEHDPGAYAHNRGYALKLITDSIDFITDGVIDGNGVPADVTAAVASREFGEKTSHTALSLANAGANACSVCHTPAPHFNTYTSVANPGYKAAYMSAGITCANCHLATGDAALNPIREAWANSGHGDTTAYPWKSQGSYIWNGRGTDNVNFQLSPQKTNCVRCHSARGFVQYWDSGFTNIGNVTVDGKVDKSSAPLTCQGCHTSADGTMRPMPAGYTKVKSFYGYSTVSIAKQKVVVSLEFTDNKNSNICLPCHAQRATGTLVKGLFAAPAFKQYSVGTAIYPHEAQPAAIVDGKGGYEFTSAQGYNDRMRHIRIGNYGTNPAGYNNTGITTGNCVGCHMTSDESHSYEVVAKDNAGLITGIKSETCEKCHPATFTYQDVQAKKEEFQAAVKVLGNILVQRGFTQDGVNPIAERKAFDMSLDKNGVKTKDNAIAEKNVGAWFNWYLFKTADKAAYVHNPAYSRRLISDSIDWLDDNVMNDSSATTIFAQQTAGKLTAPETTKAVAQLNNPGCMGCHFGTGTTHNEEVVPGIEQAPHYNTNGALVEGQTFTQAQYVTPETQCNYCHGFGHGSDSPGNNGAGGTILKDYAESGHADRNGLAWTDYDFKARATCNACHTTAGFVQALNSNYAKTTALGSTSDTTKQVLGCNACHSSTSWATSVRSVDVTTVGMGGYGAAAVATTSFDNVGQSNVCIPCHAGREDGKTIKALETAGNTFTNVSFKNPHYFAAAGVFYGKAGFQFYTSGVRYNTYGAAGKTGKSANWSHGRLGMDNYSSSGNNDIVGASNNTGNGGQCVACHMGPNDSTTLKGNHTFDALKVAKSTNATGCYGCHKTSPSFAPGDIAALNEEELEIFNRGMDFFAWELAQKNIFYTDAYPYFNNAGGTALKNWTFAASPAVGPAGGTGAQNMGAAMNFKLLRAEKGAHVHNRAFARALIADSIVYLQNGTVGDRSVTSTDPNQVINFTNYSTHLTANPDTNPVSISTLKGWLTRLSGGKYSRR